MNISTPETPLKIIKKKKSERERKEKKEILISLWDFEHFRECSIMAPQGQGNFVNLPQGGQLVREAAWELAFTRPFQLKHREHSHITLAI